jgi:hypothetical protein
MLGEAGCASSAAAAEAACRAPGLLTGCPVRSPNCTGALRGAASHRRPAHCGGISKDVASTPVDCVNACERRCGLRMPEACTLHCAVQLQGLLRTYSFACVPDCVGLLRTLFCVDPFTPRTWSTSTSHVRVRVSHVRAHGLQLSQSLSDIMQLRTTRACTSIRALACGYRSRSCADSLRSGYFWGLNRVHENVKDSGGNAGGRVDVRHKLLR